MDQTQPVVRGAGSHAPDLVPTPGQTVGPFFGFALPFEGGEDLAPVTASDAVHLHGTVFDGEGAPVPDALVEIWQADHAGQIPAVEGSLRRDGQTFTGFGRSGTDEGGRYRFNTIEPGPVAGAGAPFFAICVFARGLLNRLFTRCYLPEPAAALEQDTLLASLPQERRSTLIAQRLDDGSLRFDIHLQGDDETVFLSYPQHRE